jgi:hypothetical protein
MTPAFRIPDHSTSIAAAEKIAPVRSQLQQDVLAAFWINGPMTDGELEKLPQFVDCAPSTIRKRRSELYDKGRGVIVKTEDRRGGMIVWKVKA